MDQTYSAIFSSNLIYIKITEKETELLATNCNVLIPIFVQPDWCKPLIKLILFDVKNSLFEISKVYDIMG